jgi:hypothetical protein
LRFNSFFTAKIAKGTKKGKEYRPGSTSIFSSRSLASFAV